MFARAKTARSRPAARWALRLGCGMMVIGLGGCETALNTFVGKQTGTVAPTPPATPPVPLPTTAFITDSNLSPNYTNQTILPPTLPPAPDEAADQGAEPVVSTGPRHAIAAVPLSTAPAALAPLGEAANREQDIDDARFVLLILTPPGTDAASIERGNEAARQAAGAALRYLSDSGIPSEHVDVSLATSVNVGPGEVRLYRR